MKLIAVQPISDQLPTGASFEIPDDDLASAHTLIEAGLAREDVPAAVQENAETEAAPAQRQPSQRSYRRRDLTVEP